MAALYELVDQIKIFEFEIDEETGEILNANELDQLELERDTKIENLGLWIKDMDSDIVALKNEEQNLNKRRRAIEKKKESVKGYLQMMLQGQKFTTSKVAISYRKSDTVEFGEVFEVPEEYWNVETIRKPMKAEIKKAIKDGAEFEGVSLVEKQNIQIK